MYTDCMVQCREHGVVLYTEAREIEKAEERTNDSQRKSQVAVVLSE